MNLKNSQIGKIAAAEAALELIKPNMLIGLGTGSTASFFIEALGKRVKEGLEFSAVATSIPSLELAISLGIHMIDVNETTKLDLVIDGADEINHQKQMIKGGGGALLREKIIAHMGSEMIVIVDETKYVEHLGKFALPIEIAKFAYKVTLKEIEKLGRSANLRKGSDVHPFITDNGNYIVDLKLAEGFNAQEVNLKLKAIPGVLETGLFLNMAGRVIIGKQNGSVEII